MIMKELIRKARYHMPQFLYSINTMLTPCWIISNTTFNLNANLKNMTWNAYQLNIALLMNDNNSELKPWISKMIHSLNKKTNYVHCTSFLLIIKADSQFFDCDDCHVQIVLIRCDIYSKVENSVITYHLSYWHPLLPLYYSYILSLNTNNLCKKNKTFWKNWYRLIPHSILFKKLIKFITTTYNIFYNNKQNKMQVMQHPTCYCWLYIHNPITFLPQHNPYNITTITYSVIPINLIIITIKNSISDPNISNNKNIKKNHLNYKKNSRTKTEKHS